MLVEGHQFDKNKIVEIINEMVDNVYELHINTVYRKDAEESTRELANLEKKSAAVENAVDEKEVIEVDDPFMNAIYKKFINKKTTTSGNEGVPARCTQHFENKRTVLKKEIQEEVQEYIDKCTNMDVMKILEIYGTPKFYEDQKKGILDLGKISYVNDPLVIGQYFDLIKWWRNDGTQSYPRLSTAATIILGKPTHNAFQERVFSKGNYHDSSLKKKTTEVNFEMSLLNSLNFKALKDIQKELKLKRVDCSNVKRVVSEVRDFFKRGEGEEIIIELPPETITIDGVEEEDDEILSMAKDDDFIHDYDSDLDSDIEDFDMMGTDTSEMEITV